MWGETLERRGGGDPGIGSRIVFLVLVPISHDWGSRGAMLRNFYMTNSAACDLTTSTPEVPKPWI